MTRYRHLITDDNRKWWTLGAMCFALFMVMLDNTVVNVALPSIQRELHAHISQLEWVINGYTLTFAVLIATGGRLGDIFGRRLMFLTGVVIFAITSATAGLAQDSAMLIGSRAIQGIGAALMMPATLSIITHTFPAAERGRAIGIWAGVSALALSIGPVVGGALTEYVSWRAIFFINLPVAAGSDGDLWLSLLEEIVLPAGGRFAPRLILVSAGFDAHRADPLASCVLEAEDFARMASSVRGLADELGAPLGAVLEGGYDVDALAECVVATLRALGEPG